MFFDVDCLRRIGLKKTRGGQESNSNLRRVVGRYLDDSKLSCRIVNCPHHMSISFDAETLRNALQLGVRAWSFDGANEIIGIRGYRVTCS